MTPEEFARYVALCDKETQLRILEELRALVAKAMAEKADPSPLVRARRLGVQLTEFDDN